MVGTEGDETSLKMLYQLMQQSGQFEERLSMPSLIYSMPLSSHDENVSESPDDREVVQGVTGWWVDRAVVTKSHPRFFRSAPSLTAHSSRKTAQLQFCIRLVKAVRIEELITEKEH